MRARRRSAVIFPSRDLFKSQDKMCSSSQVLVREATRTPSATTVGTLVGFTGAGRALVSCGKVSATKAMEARSCIALRRDQIGRDVVVVFADSQDESLPIVIGMIHDPQRDGDVTAHRA